MAEDELPPEEVVETDVAPEEVQQTEDPISKLAMDLGWTPKEQFTGDPEKWKPAEQFIRDGREIQRSLSHELKDVKSQLSNIARVTDTIFEDRWQQRERDLLGRKDEAIEAGDKAAVYEIDKQLAERPQPASRPSTEVDEFKSRNQWFDRDPVARNFAFQICEMNKNLAPAEQLRIAEDEVRKRFPEHFPAPPKPQASVNEPNGRGPGRRSSGKSFADLPKAAQDMAIKFENERGVPRAEYAARYFNQQETVR